MRFPRHSSALLSLSALLLGVACGDEFRADPGSAGSGGTATGTTTGTATGTATGTGGGAGSGGGSLLELGQACDEEGTCASGFCVDGYCCESACDEICRVCDRAVSDGIDGRCRPAEAGTDGDDECGDGVCDGAAACALGEELFVQAYGDAATNLNQLALDVAADSQGDLIVVGYYSGDLKLGTVTLAPSNSGSRDIFVAKIDGDNHNTLWAFRVGGTGDDDGRAVTVDANDDVYVVGAYQQSFSMDPLDATTPAKQLPTAGTTQNAFIAKYGGADGDYVWSKGVGDGMSNVRANGVAVLSDGAVVYVGEYTGTASVGGPALPNAGGTENLFVARLDPTDGSHQHSMGYGDADNDAAAAVAATSDGGVWIAGHFGTAIDFTPPDSGGAGEYATLAGPDAFVVKLHTGSSSFDHVASRRFGGSGSQRAFSVAVNDYDQPHLIGEYDTEIDIDGNVTAGQGAADVYVVRMSDDGANVIWAKQFGDTEPVSGLDVACGPQGFVYVTGDFAGTIDLGGGPLQTAGSGDAFIAKYHPDGTHLWSHRYGNDELQTGIALAPDNQHRVWLTGKLLNTAAVNFGQAGAIQGVGAADFFLLQIGR